MVSQWYGPAVYRYLQPPLPLTLFFQILGGEFHIMAPAVFDHCTLFLPRLPFYLRGRTHYNRFRRDLKTGWEQGTGGNKRTSPDFAAVQYDRSDSNEAFVFYSATVEDNTMAD